MEMTENIKKSLKKDNSNKQSIFSCDDRLKRLKTHGFREKEYFNKNQENAVPTNKTNTPTFHSGKNPTLILRKNTFLEDKFENNTINEEIELKAHQNRIISEDSKEDKDAIVKSTSKHKSKKHRLPLRYKTININVNDHTEMNSIVGGIAKSNIQKLNININIKNVNQQSPMKVTEKIEENEISSNNENKSKTDHCNSPSKSKVKWRRLSNLFKSITQFKRHETKNIASDVEIEKEIIEHKEKLFVKRNSMYNPDTNGLNLLLHQQSTAPEKHQQKFYNLADKEMFKLSLKEKCLKILIDGDAKLIEKLKLLFNQEPESSIKNKHDHDYLFNQTLSNGKTLLYIACQEGLYSVVEFLIDYGLNPFIKCKSGNDELESCLQVSSRWGYFTVVEFLLNKVNYNKNEIKEAIQVENLSKKVRNLLEKHKKKKFKKCCSCF